MRRTRGWRIALPAALLAMAARARVRPSRTIAPRARRATPDGPARSRELHRRDAPRAATAHPPRTHLGPAASPRDIPANEMQAVGLHRAWEASATPGASAGADLIEMRGKTQ